MSTKVFLFFSTVPFISLIINQLNDAFYFQTLNHLPFSLPSPYVELVNILLSCGEEVKEALTRSVRLQCEQNWGALCDSLSLCSSLVPSPASSAIEHHRHVSSSRPEPEHPRPPRQGDKDKAGKVGFNVHPRNRSQGPRRHNPETGVVAEQEVPKATDVRR